MTEGIGGIGNGLRMPQELPEPTGKIGTAGGPGSAGRAASTPDGGFASTMKEFLGEVNELQKTSETKFGAFVRGEAEIHEVAIAAREAEIAVRLTMEIRDRLLNAYHEVMRMPV